MPMVQFDGATCTLALHHLARPERRLPRSRAHCWTPRYGPPGHFHIDARADGPLLAGPLFPEDDGAVGARHAVAWIRSRMRLARPASSASKPSPIMSRRTLTDMFLYSGKHRPKLYLDARVPLPAFRVLPIWRKQMRLRRVWRNWRPILSRGGSLDIISAAAARCG